MLFEKSIQLRISYNIYTFICVLDRPSEAPGQSFIVQICTSLFAKDLREKIFSRLDKPEMACILAEFLSVETCKEIDSNLLPFFR